MQTRKSSSATVRHSMGQTGQHGARTSVTVAWSRTFATSGAHTVLLVNLTGGTSGRMGFDGTVALA